jgi:small GTP-binding protein
VIDTAGLSDFQAIREMQIRDGKTFILCFSITDRESFNAVRTFYDQLVEEKGYDPCVVLVGTKCDLPRQIEKSEARDLARQLGINYFETSAKEAINVDTLFAFMANMAETKSLIDAHYVEWL